jgi:hypothetical protein
VAAAAQPAPSLIDPPRTACPPALDSPHYSGNRDINFRWQFAGSPAAGGAFTVQVGPYGGGMENYGPGSLSGQTNNEWAFPVSVGSIYQDGTTEYQWRVVYLASGQNPVFSEWSCFRITSDGGGAPADTPTSEPPPSETPVPYVSPTATVPPPTATPPPTEYPYPYP